MLIAGSQEFFSLLYKTRERVMDYSGNADLFRLAVEEETDTLLTYDVVDLDHTASAELLDMIRKEGVVLYEEV